MTPLTGIAIRRPSPEHAEGAARVHVQCWQEAYGGLLPADYFTEDLLRSRTRLWDHLAARASDEISADRVALCDGQVIGIASAGPCRDGDLPPGLELYCLYVPAARYGTGLGAALMHAVLGDAPASLWVARENPRARRFYEKHGFAAAGAEATDDRFGLAEIRMVR